MPNFVSLFWKYCASHCRKGETRLTGVHKHKQTDRQTNRDRKINKQRQTDKQADTDKNR